MEVISQCRKCWGGRLSFPFYPLTTKASSPATGGGLAMCQVADYQARPLSKSQNFPGSYLINCGVNLG